MTSLSVRYDKTVPALRKAYELLVSHSRVFDVCEAEETDRSDFTLTLSFPDGMADETFRLYGKGKNFCLESKDLPALLYGVGYLLRQGKAAFKEGETVEKPKKTVRGMYFANHFYNFYHVAPLEEVRGVIEDLALWGCNTVELWFDMHHFTSLHDPEAEKMIARMKEIFRFAKEVGMKTSLTCLANEYYAGADPSLLAQNSTDGTGYVRRLGGFYNTELCPSVPEARKALLLAKKEFFEAFRDVSPDYVCLWPYDQGGCTCHECFPWGANGYYHLAKEEAALIRSLFPNAKIILSTWMFDRFTPEEFDRFVEVAGPDGRWFDFLMIEQTENARNHAVALGIPAIDFPEISMYGATPWGGFGANPFADKLAERYARVKDLLDGGFPYSEGFFDDVNKMLLMQYYWRGTSEDTAKILAEYARYRFGEGQEEKIADFIRSLGETLPRYRLNDGVKCNYPSFLPTSLPQFVIEHPENVSELCRAAEEIDGKLPEFAREDKFWLILKLRAMLDDALLRADGIPNDETDRIAARIASLYHSDDTENHAFYCVAPITREAIMANRGREMLL